MVRKAIKAGRADDWSEVMKSDELNPWTMAKLKGSYFEAKQDDDQRKSVVQQIKQKNTDFLRRIIVPVEGQGGVTTVVRVPSLTPIFRVKITFGGSRRGTVTAARARSSVSGGARLVAPSAAGGTRTESRLHRIVRIPARRRCCGRTRHLRGPCENLVCASQVDGEPAGGRRQPRGSALRGFTGSRAG